MNNNKKYKKWSLGLVAPALVLAPIAVVASCSSSREEKPAYSVSFKQPTLSVEVNNKNVKPSKLSREGFVQEIINNKANIFNIEDSSGKVTDDFLKENLVVGVITPDDSKNTASAEVTLNNKNTDGGSESATITLTGFDYQEEDLSKLTYKIDFVDSTNLQTIELEGKSEVSVTSLNKSSLIRLVLEENIKKQILAISGDDAAKITNDVLENQILEITDASIEAVQADGTIKFELKVLNDGTTTKAEKSKQIVFAGFKKETDAPETPKYKITLKTTATAKEYQFAGIDSKLASSLTTGEMVRDLIIANKEQMFDLTDQAPTDEAWWKSKLVISQPSPNDAEGKITFNLVLDDSNTIDATDESSSKINERDIVIKGFKVQASTPTTGKPTTSKTELSTVTLGLNGNRQEVKDQIDEQWIFDHLNLLFDQGTELIEDVNGIVSGSVLEEDLNQSNGKPESGNPINLKFKLDANKWYDDQGAVGTGQKEITIKIKGLSGGPTKGQPLSNKSDAAAPLGIGLVDPTLAEKTYEEYKKDAENFFNKDFVFKYRKHLLTGDFSQIDAGTADDFLVDYGNSKFVNVESVDSNKTIKITFKILAAKLVNPSPNTDKEYSVIFSGFKASSN